MKILLPNLWYSVSLRNVYQIFLEKRLKKKHQVVHCNLEFFKKCIHTKSMKNENLSSNLAKTKLTRLAPTERETYQFLLPSSSVTGLPPYLLCSQGFSDRRPRQQGIKLTLDDAIVIW